MDADLKVGGFERRMEYDRNDGEEPSMSIAAAPDDGTRRRKRRV